MADTKISALTTKATPIGADILPIVDSTNTSNKKVTIQTLPISDATQTALNAKQNTLGFTPENVANKSTNTSLGTSNTQYPSQNAVKSYVDTGLAAKQNTLGFTPENVANKENTALDTSTTKYPSNNVVKTAVDLKANDSDVVKLTGDQSIAGVKTFSEDIRLIKSSGTSRITISSPLATDPKILSFRTNDVQRWAFRVDAAGDDIFLRRYNDSGVYQGDALSANRSTGLVSINDLAPLRINTRTAIVNFGPGNDGAGTISNNIQLARSTYYSSLTITNTGELRPVGFYIYCSGLLTINAGGRISANGGAGGTGNVNGTGGTGGGVVQANEYATTAGGVAGGAGGAGGTGIGSPAASVNAQSSLISANAGTSGAGGSGNNGGGGASRAGAATNFRPHYGVTVEAFRIGTALKGAGQSAPGGGGGGGDLTSGAGGGGGGAGAGVLMIFCDRLNNLGEIQARGGNGGDGGSATAGNRGGGGGGGGGTGGYVYIICREIINLGTINVSGGVGGAGGSGFGTGTNGTNGTDGTSGTYAIYETSTNTWTIV
jgi:hypothetical protein